MNPQAALEELSRHSRRNATVSALGIALVIVGLVYSAQRLYRLQAAIALVDAELTQKKEQLKELEKALDEKEKQVALASEKVKALGAVIYQVGSTQPGATTQAFQATLNLDPKVAQALPRVFIHIAKTTQMAEAKDVATLLQERGYLIPAIRIVDNAPHDSQIRYFRREDSKEAETIAQSIGSLHLSVVAKDFQSGYEHSPNVHPRQFELWLAKAG